MRRRQYLSSTLAVCTCLSVGGCAQSQSGWESPPELEDVLILNETERKQKVTITVTHEATGEILLEETTSIPTGEDISDRSVSFQDPVSSGGVHRVQVAVEDGPTGAYDWDVGGDENEQDETHSLEVYIQSEEITFGESVA